MPVFIPACLVHARTALIAQDNRLGFRLQSFTAIWTELGYADGCQFQRELSFVRIHDPDDCFERVLKLVRGKAVRYFLVQCLQGAAVNLQPTDRPQSCCLLHDLRSFQKLTRRFRLIAVCKIWSARNLLFRKDLFFDTEIGRSRDEAQPELLNYRNVNFQFIGQTPLARKQPKPVLYENISSGKSSTEATDVTFETKISCKISRNSFA